METKWSSLFCFCRNPVQSEQTAFCGSDDQSPGQMKSTASNGNANNKDTGLHAKSNLQYSGLMLKKQGFV